MNLKDRQKMCSHCDGRIPYEAEQCPYCGSDQAKSMGMAAKESHHRSLQDSLTAPYNPSPARALPSGASLNPSNPLSTSMLEKKKTPFVSSSPLPTAQSANMEKSSSEGNRAFFPILLLCLAGNLMTIGLLLLLFSNGGVMRLEWDASYWFAYCLAAMPLLFLGLKKAKEVI